MILVKIEAVGGINDIHPKLWKVVGRIAQKLELRFKLDMMINSTNGDKHMDGSFHYIGRAVDFSLVRRNNTLSDNERKLVDVDIRKVVDGYEELMGMKGDYDLIYYESGRAYHIEYDPKGD